ncbi:hypothetical protein PC116_g5672 [Phytophthora cactorum]|uniref:Uncharacterized protein n=1 Tax=Phytophthora cactorum TaxID=29920 RepID=A0A8T1EEA7_9STRA|nr:hypothetical protein Pcac1_g27664 [Phytophthora cactorum]KAG2926285.1 hypothetical protein PC114_g3842 [Phytophthora cactorum]KAG2950082.1 hypothetical protein PC117_g4700 [Phytophthora cactorum]KAG3009305.1 hypothetical protein PC120_g15712 [Phytophthora cactorum]KAG3019110.1 hypothetical protein PC119_g10440 [Phytophthora cactorum]
MLSAILAPRLTPMRLTAPARHRFATPPRSRRRDGHHYNAVAGEVIDAAWLRAHHPNKHRTLDAAILRDFATSSSSTALDRWCESQKLWLPVSQGTLNLMTRPPKRRDIGGQETRHISTAEDNFNL